MIFEFNDYYQKFAIDERLEKLLPQIKQAIPYKRMCLIFEQMQILEEKIKKDVLAEKKRKDKESAIKEKVIAEKSIIYGIDQRNYENYLDYLNAVNKRIVEVCEYKINNIKRHIEANKKIYITLLKKNDSFYKTLKTILDSFYEGFDIHEYCVEEVCKIIEENIDASKKVKITEELINLYCNAVYQFDSDISNEKSLVSLLSKIRTERSWDECKYDEDGKRTAKPNDMYDFILGIQNFYGNACEEIINYPNPIFNGSRIVQKDFKKCMDVLLQIASLKKQLAYYESIKENPDKSLLNFQNRSNSWNSIIHFPYWLRLGRDTSKKDPNYIKESFNLLMIQPGVKDIDLNNIRTFTRNNGQEFGSTKIERQEYLKKVMLGNQKCLFCERLMVTIPKSLDFESIIKITDYVHQYGGQLQFVCESQDVAVTIKEILVDRAILAYQQVSIVSDGNHVDNYKKIRNRYFKDRCFVCVDPNYYTNFMLDTPSNKVFWHRYDYTGNYKFRKQEPISFDYLIDYVIYKNTHNGVIDYERICKQLLGSYSSKEPKVETVTIHITDFMDYIDFYRYPECKDLNFMDLMNYVDSKFGNRFDLEDIYDGLYESNYEEENDHPNAGEVYTKVLKRRFTYYEDENELPFN